MLWFVFCFKQKTAYEMRISDWSSDVCSSDLSGFDITGKESGMAQRLHEKPGIGFDRPGRGEVQFVSKYLRCLIARRRRGHQLGNHWIVEGGYRGIFFDPGFYRSEERRVGTEGVGTCRSRWRR